MMPDRIQMHFSHASYSGIFALVSRTVAAALAPSHFSYSLFVPSLLYLPCFSCWIIDRMANIYRRLLDQQAFLFCFAFFFSRWPALK